MGDDTARLSAMATAFYAGGSTCQAFVDACTAEHGADVCAWLQAQIAAIEPEECEDNHRLAFDGHPPDVARYEDAASSGCCGFDDQTFIHPGTGKVFRYGFNYGH